MKVQGHSIDEQWDLIQQFEGLVEHGLTAVVETWLEHHGVTSALTAAAEGESLLDGEGSFSALWNSQVEGVFTTYLTSVYDASSLAVAHEAMSQADLASGLGVAGVPDDYSADFVTKTANKMVGVSDQVWHNIRTQLAQGVSENETIEELADRVRTAVSVSMPRALTVARTTVIAASNAGSYAQASLLAGEGGMRKTWVATEDNRVRPDHHNADGQTVAMTSMFMVGGFPMAYPGDPAGPPEEVINCRCTITYEFDDLASVCECGAEPALVAAAKAPKIQTPMGAACICPAVASLTPAGFTSITKKIPQTSKEKAYQDFQKGGKITPSMGGAKIHQRLMQVIKKYQNKLGMEDIEGLLDLIDEQYALQGGKTSFKAKYEEWLATNAGKKAVPQAIIPAAPVAAPAVAPTSYLAGWDGLTTTEQSDFAHLWKAFKQDVKTGATPQEAFEIIVSDITDNPSAWGSLIKSASTDDLKGYMQVAGQKLGDDVTSLSTISTGGISAVAPAAPSLTVAGFDASDAALHFTQTSLNKMASEIKKSLASGDKLSTSIANADGAMQFAMSSSEYKYLATLTDDQIVSMLSEFGKANGADMTWLDQAYAKSKGIITPAPAVGVPVAAPAVDYASLWSQLDPPEHANFKKAFLDAKSYHDTGAPLDEVLQSLKQDIIDNPTEWVSIVKNSSVDDIKGMIKVAGDELGEDTSWLGGVSNAPSALIAPAGDPANLAAAKALLQPIDFDALAAELKYQVTIGPSDLAEAVQHTLHQISHLMSKQTATAVENLTDDQIFALIKDYQASVGQSSDWLDAALAKNAPAPAVVPVAPTIVVPMSTEDVYGIAQSLGLSKSDLPSLMYDFAQQQVNFPGDLAGLIAKVRSLSGTNLTKKGAKALAKISDDDLAKLVKDYGDSLGKDTSFITLPTPAAAPVTPISTTVDLLDISSISPADAKKLYDGYKQLKPVTPSWGGAAIYKNLQTVKKLLGPEYAGLNDGQLLKLLDQVWYQNAKAGSKSYYDEVMAWLKTPGGKKYLKDNGIMSPPEPGGITPTATKAPSVPPAAPSVAPVAPVTPAAPVKAAKAAKVAKPPVTLDPQKWIDKSDHKTISDAVTHLQNIYATNGGDLADAVHAVRSLGSAPPEWISLTDDQIVATLKTYADQQGLTTTFPMPVVKMKKLPTPAVKFAAADGDISGIDAGLKQTIFQKIKDQSVYLSSTGQKIWDTLQAVAKLPGMTDASGKPKYTLLQLVRILDEQSAAKFGVTNTSQYEQKLVKWLKTANGKAHAGGIPGGGAKIPAGPTPAGVKFDPGPVTRNITTTPETYPILSTREALDMQNGQPAWTAAQKAGLKTYTGSSYSTMNGALRAGQSISDTMARHIRAAQAGMRPSTRPMLLHRGSGTGQFKSLGVTHGASFSDIKALEGQEFVDDAFLSTSVGGSAAFGGQPVLLEIEAPTGTPMAYVDHISLNRGENEMLLAAGTRYKILTVSQSGTGYYNPIVVRMRIIP